MEEKPICPLHLADVEDVQMIVAHQETDHVER